MTALVLLAACEAIPHPNFVAREGPGSPVTFELLSGDAHFAVVRSTGPGATVPAAGRWRVDRSTGSVVTLPDGDQAVKVSRGGERVLVMAGNDSVIWAAGATLAPPAGAKFSDQLTYGVFVDTGGAVKRWETATQSITPVEIGIPRPAGATKAVAKAISDDGLTAEYTLSGPQLAPVERFANLAAGTAVDRPFLSGPVNSYMENRFTLAADGTGFVQVYESGRDDLGVRRPDEAWADLVELPSGLTRTRYTSTSRESIEREFISADGDRAWVYQSRREYGDACIAGLDPSFTCIVGSHAIAFWAPNGRRSFDTGAFDLGGIDVSRNRAVPVARQVHDVALELAQGSRADPRCARSFARGRIARAGGDDRVESRLLGRRPVERRPSGRRVLEQHRQRVVRVLRGTVMFADASRDSSAAVNG